MSTSGISYAAAVSTPSGTVRQPEIKAQALSDHDSRTSLDAPAKPQRPGGGTRSRTSFRGWSKKAAMSEEEASSYQPGPVKEIPYSGHYPRDEHRPNTENDEELVYVLTMKISDSLAKPMNEMRAQYFPKRLNRIPAHLTLFHALPHSHMEVLEQSLSQTCLSMQPFAVSTGKPFRMRKGVGVNVDAGYNELKNVHQQLQSQWQSFLSEQDAGGFRPHWTVMNKVDDEVAVNGAFESIRNDLSQRSEEGQALGLDLWRYNRGNWDWEKEFVFGKGASSAQVSDSRYAGDTQGNGEAGGTGEKARGGSSKRPGMWKRGSSVGDALRTMSFRRKS
ncbi:hypothetical protein NX059_007987 [Plenodomus lindquistii]|nr:hypothetical protein NX059_007987 [Plenodomus lindquistii]